jgi:hypothetical protein
LIPAGIAAGLYSNYVGVINERDKTIKSLNSRLYELQIENQTALYQALNTSLNAQILVHQNEIKDYQAQVSSLNSQIEILHRQISSSGGNAGAEAEIARLQQQVNDLQGQITSKVSSIDSLNRLNTISLLANFNDSGVWLDQTSGSYLQVAKQSIFNEQTLSLSGLNLVPGKFYFVTLSLVGSSPNESETAYFYVNGDIVNGHYDSSFLYGNSQSSWPSFQYEDDARIFDSNLFVGSEGMVFSGIMVIDPIGTLRMGLPYNAIDTSTSNPVTGFYGWTYNGSIVSSVNRLDLVSNAPLTGTLAIYDPKT